MSLPRFSVRRPVTTVMIYAAVVLLGVIAWFRLPQELFPPITYPQLTVVTRYKDAAPEEIEILVTKLIEEVVGTVSGLRRVSSISKEELSLVIAEFNWGTNMDFAGLGVREKIDLIKERLPRGAEDPVVIKFNPFELPVFVLNVSGEIPPNELLVLARKQIKTELEKVEGVAVVNVSGGLEREIQVEVDQGRLQASDLPISQVVEAVQRANLNYPAGTIKEAFYEYLIRTIGEFKLVPEIPSIAVGVEEEKGKVPKKEPQQEERPGPLRRDKGLAPPQRVILMKDIAVVKDTFKERSSVSRFNGKENISLSVQKQAGANTLQVASRVKEAMDRIRPTLPAGIQISVAYDQSVFIRQSIEGVRDAAIQGGFLAFLVLFIFLGNFWAALNVTFAIPISALATIGPMYFSGITINVISMGGLALAIGMLVDAGTVAVENIDLKRQDGKPPREAAIGGTEEISSALFGTINTTVVVFLPMIFVVGIAGQLFKELAYTVTLSNYASLAVALTLTPLFASRIRYGSGRSPIEPVVDRMRRFDTVLVKWFLKHRFIAIVMILGLFAGSVVAFGGLDRETLPKVDQGQFILRANLPPGTRLNVTDQVAKRIEKVLLATPEVRDVTVTIGSSKEKRAEELLETLGSHQAQILVNLKPRYRGWARAPDLELYRTKTTSEIVQDLKETLKREPLEAADIEYLLQESVFKSSFLSGTPVVVEVKGSDLNRIEQLSNQVKEALGKVDGLYGIQTSLIAPSPETKVHVKKDRAAAYHLSVSDIALTAQTAVKGFIASKFKEEGKEYDIRVRLRKEDREDLNKVRRLLIHSPLEIDVPLAEVAYFAVGKGPTEIRHLDQQRTILIWAHLYQRPLNEVIQEVAAVLKEIAVPTGYTVALTGENQQMQESFQSLAFALILSVVLVYMVMASEFESLWQPLLIMGTIPMGLIGVVLILWLTHTPVSIMVILGIIILGGLVVDDGIVLVDYINLVRNQGVPLQEAVVLASERRLRPILMTSATTVLGLLPMALGLEEGVELQGPMAIAVMGGMTVCTFLTLFFLPTIYCVGAEFFGQFRKMEVPIPAPEPAAAMAGADVGASIHEPELKVEYLSPETPVAEPSAPADLPDIPEGFGGEEAAPQRPESHFILPGAPLEPPEPPEQQPPAVPPAILSQEPSEESPPPEPPTPEAPPPLSGEKPLPEEPPLPEKEESLEEEPPVRDLGASLEEPPAPEKPAEPPPPAAEGPIPPIFYGPPSLPPVSPPSMPPIGLPPLTQGAAPSPEHKLNPRQEQLLEYVETHGRITRKEYVQMTGASVPTAARDLKELVDRGLIKGVGPLAKGRYYVLTT